jgi:hypothetical protein
MLSNEAQNQYVDFESIQKLLGLNDMTLFLSYLKELYKDLAERSEGDKKKGINKVTFYDYMKLPIFIAEKLFCALDKDNDSFLNSHEFIEGLQDLYMGDFESTLEIIFNTMDFDKDGLINREDVKVLLSYLPLKTDNIHIEYKFQMQSLSEIDEILDSTFEKKNQLNKEHFEKIISNKKSDVYLQILCFLYQKKPFQNQNVRRIKDSKKKVTFTPKSKKSSPNLFKTGSLGEAPKKMFITPSKKSTLSPAEAFITAAQLSEEILNPRSKKSFYDRDTPQISGMKGMVRLNNQKIPTEKYTDSPNINDVVKKSKDGFASPSQFFKKASTNLSKKKNDIEKFDVASNLIKMENLDLNADSESSSGEEDEEEEIKKSKKNKKKEKDKNILQSIKKDDNKINDNEISMDEADNEIEEKEEILYENWVYKISTSNKLIKYFLVIIGKDIFYYKTDKKDELLGMHNLSGCYIKANGDKIVNGNKLYCFQIVFPSKHRNYYTSTKQIAEDFVINLKKGIGYQNFFDFYEMLDDIGEGKFGLVKLGLHKSTQERVAIKIIKKSSMKDNDAELVRTEIDIMKLCHHPNVVRLLDHFENAEYIFIVMEYLSGGSLKDYFAKNRFNFSEKRAAEVMFQIGLGIRYLHQYGVVHRDLKPDNIMMTEKDDMSQIKIMDFGLSKIMGPKETVADGFGTLSFVAPEVLVRTPYNKEIDIWSIGVILYYMLTGCLPFDDESDNEEVIAKMIVFEELKFPKSIWSNRSPKVIDLIKNCLNKSLEKRYKINQFLSHEWFRKNGLNIEDYDGELKEPKSPKNRKVGFVNN